MFPEPVISPELLAARFVELLPAYLPGVDTGAFEPTDRRRCWNKTLKLILSVMAKDNHLEPVTDSLAVTMLKDQAAILWHRNDAPVFAAVTGWGDRKELETSLQWTEAFKSPQKLFVYTCAKWQDAVLEQIESALRRYPYHIEGEQYLFMNLLGAENRFILMAADLLTRKADGSFNMALRPVAGSPFGWKTKNPMPSERAS